MRNCDTRTIPGWINIDENITSLCKQNEHTLKSLSTAKEKFLAQKNIYAPELCHERETENLLIISDEWIDLTNNDSADQEPVVIMGE